MHYYLQKMFKKKNFAADIALFYFKYQHCVYNMARGAQTFAFTAI